MKFSPKKEEELGLYGILPDGTYDFHVIKAVDKISKAGNEMIELEIVVSSEEGTKSKVYEYLLESWPQKLKHFCGAVGLVKQYESGLLTADMCKGVKGLCEITLQKAESVAYTDRNVIKDYIVSESKNEEVPF